MPRKKKTPVVTPAIDLPKEFLEKLIPGPMDAAGVEAVFQQLKKAVIERALGAELGLHLADAEGGSGNHRNGRSGKNKRPKSVRHKSARKAVKRFCTDVYSCAYSAYNRGKRCYKKHKRGTRKRINIISVHVFALFIRHTKHEPRNQRKRNRYNRGIVGIRVVAFEHIAGGFEIRI